MTSSARSRRFIETKVLLVAILGTALVYLDQTAIDDALPSLWAALQAEIADLQRIIDIVVMYLWTALAATTLFVRLAPVRAARANQPVLSEARSSRVA